MSARATLKPAFASWSGGKDSALALYRAKQTGYDVKMLFVMMDETGERSRSHATQPELLRMQAQALGIEIVFGQATWKRYEECFVRHLCEFRERGITHGIFGDIDILPNREWEEKVCTRAGIVAHLPLWGERREALVKEVISLKFQPIVVCCNGKYLGKEFCGRAFDSDFVGSLPEGVDACGENGEYHTFVMSGPIFAHPVCVRVEEVYSIVPTAPGAGEYHYARLVLGGGSV